MEASDSLRSNKLLCSKTLSLSPIVLLWGQFCPPAPREQLAMSGAIFGYYPPGVEARDGARHSTWSPGADWTFWSPERHSLQTFKIIGCGKVWVWGWGRARNCRPQIKGPRRGSCRLHKVPFWRGAFRTSVSDLDAHSPRSYSLLVLLWTWEFNSIDGHWIHTTIKAFFMVTIWHNDETNGYVSDKKWIIIRFRKFFLPEESYLLPASF